MNTAVVTGGGSGIGLAITERLSADGYHVATLDLNPSGTAFAQKADVADRAQVDEALAAIRAQLGPVTILVNAAGMEGYKRFINLTFAAWQRLIDVNLNGVFHCTQAVLPDMLEAAWGRIVNISSSSAQSVHELARTLAPLKIRANIVHPTNVSTDMLHSEPMYQSFRPDLEHPTRQDAELAFPVQQAMPIPYVEPVDISNAVLFLASDEARYITGM